MPDSVDGTASKISPTTPSAGERRSVQLEGVSLAAKAFVPVSETEIDCIVTALSPDGASISTPAATSLGSEIVLYIEGFDRFSAAIVSTAQEVVRVKFHCSPNKRARTAEKIACYRNGQTLTPTNVRVAQRAPLHSVRTFKRKNGETVDFEVIDISLSGTSLRTKCRPEIGEIITIGTVEGRVTRHFDDGIAVEFARRSSPNLNILR